MRLAATIRAVISASFSTAVSIPSSNDVHSLETRDASSFVGRWTAWGKIDSGITPNITFHPNAKIAAEWSNNNTHINVFTTDNTGAVYTAEFDYAWKEWRGWSPVHAETKFAIGASVTMLWRGDYRLHLFITDASGGVWYAFKDDGVPEWTPWFSIHPEMKFGAGATVTAVARDAHHMDLFICDNDGAVWSTWWDGGELEGWHPWFLIDLRQSFNLEQVTTVRALWNDNGSRLDLVGAHHSGYLLTSSFQYDDKGWSPWDFQVGATPLMMQTAVPSMVWYRDGERDILCVGNDGKMYAAAWVNGRWGSWSEPFPGSPGSPNFVYGTELSVVSAMEPAGRGFAAYVVDDQANIQYLSSGAWQVGEWWNGWWRVPTLDKMRPGQHVSAIESNPLHVDLFVTKTDGTVWNIWYDETAK